MKKTLAIVSLIVLAATLGFSNASWAVDRPNTPECADVNGRSDPDACHIQYVGPLIVEMVEMRYRLMKLQGENSVEDLWTFMFDSPTCDLNSSYYDNKFCLLQMPGKLALEKYRLREEIMKLEALQKIKKQKTKQVLVKTTIGRLMDENKVLADKLAASEQKNKELSIQVSVLTGEVVAKSKMVEEREQQKKFLLLWMSGTFTMAMIGAVCIIVFLLVRLDRVRNVGSPSSTA